MKEKLFTLFIIASLLVGGVFTYKGLSGAQTPPDSGVNTLAGGDGTIGTLDQFKSDGTNITQRTANKPIKITGLSDGCLALSSSIVTSSGAPCGGGSGASFGKTWEIAAGFLSPTTSIAIKVDGSASSTFSKGIESGVAFGSPFVVATSSQATSTFFGGLKIAASRSGFLKAVAGDVLTALISLTADVSGTLPISSGGTNATALSKALLWFDGTSVQATSSQVTVGSILSTTTATSTFAGGIQTLQILTNYIEATGTASSSITAGLQVGQIGATSGTSTLRGLTVLTGGIKVPTIASCSQALETDANGAIVCGTDQNSGGTVTQIVAGLGLTGGTITNSGTINSAWDVISGNQISSSTRATTTLLSGGIQTLALQTNFVEATGTATSTFSSGVRTNNLYASATSTLNGLQIQSQGLKIGAISGFLKAVAGDVTTALVSLTADITGTLGIGNGGTNNTTFSANSLLEFDAASGKVHSTTTSPFRVGSTIATTTATSTYAGGVQELNTLTGFIEATSTSATSTFSHGISATRIGTTATSSMFGLQVTGGLKVNLASCDTLDTNAAGDVICGTDQNTSLSGGINNTITTFTGAGTVVATSSFPLWIATLNATSTASSTFAGALGIGTSTPFAKLAVEATAGMTFPIVHIASSSNATPFFSINGWNGWTAFGTSTASTSRQSSLVTIWDEQTSGKTAFNIANSASTTILNIPNNLTSTSTFFGGLQALQVQANSFFATSTNATSTFSGGLTADSLTITKRPTFTGITSALILTGAQGQTSAYAGSAPCTNQVALSISGTGVITCSSITDAMISGAIAYAHGGTGQTVSFPNNSIIATQGTAFQATSTQPLYTGSLFGTTTATSTLNGGLQALRLLANTIEATSTNGYNYVMSRFGVGTTSPFSTFSLKAGAGTNPIFTVASNASDRTSYLSIASDGRLTVGTTTSTSTQSSLFTIWDEQTAGKTAFNVVAQANKASTSVFSIPNTFNSTSTLITGLQVLRLQTNTFDATSTNGTSTVSNGFSAKNGVFTTIFDAGAATTFRIMQAAALTLTSIAGAMGIDTTSGQLRWWDGTKTHYAEDTECKNFNMASTTGPIFSTDEPFGLGPVATTTYGIFTPSNTAGYTLDSITCKTDQGVALLQINNDGSNPTFRQLYCKTALTDVYSATTSFSANNTFAQYTTARIAIGSATGTIPNVIYGSVCFRQTSD